MSNTNLPERASLEYLKKLAKDRLRELRRTAPDTKLAAALLSVARDHGYASWRALRAAFEQRETDRHTAFFDACRNGDSAALALLLAQSPELAHASDPQAEHRGWTGLHAAAERGHTAAVRLLIEHGAAVNARDAGDNASALHFAAGYGHRDTVVALLDAGADVHGVGDLHESEVIGWATALLPEGKVDKELIARLLERGARHHIFSAMAVGEVAQVQALVEQNPESLERRMSRFEQRRGPLHFAIERKRYDMIDLLIGLGADLEAEDGNGRTPLMQAMLSGDRAAMRRLSEAGAQQPPIVAVDDAAAVRAAAAAVYSSAPMIGMKDVHAAVEWFVALGFELGARHENAGVIDWAKLTFGRSEVMLTVAENGGAGEDVTLWFYTRPIEPLYRLLRAKQLRSSQRALHGEPGDARAIDFVEDLYRPFYGGQQFSIRGPGGYTLTFYEQA